MTCSCHGVPMLWQIDTRETAGGHWECRQKRREYNAKRLKIFGQSVYVADPDAREFARRLRDERKEATRGRA